jgi:hypothetical protein
MLVFGTLPRTGIAMQHLTASCFPDTHNKHEMYGAGSALASPDR